MAINVLDSVSSAENGQTKSRPEGNWIRRKEFQCLGNLSLSGSGPLSDRA